MTASRLTLAGAAGLALLAGTPAWAQLPEWQTGGLSWRAQVRLGSAQFSQAPPQLVDARASYALPTGMLLGDYHFSFSNWGWSRGLRASGGLYLAGTAPLAEMAFAPSAMGSSTAAGPHLFKAWHQGADVRDSRPYLGLGYSRQGLWGRSGQWGLTADLGLLAEPGNTSLTTRRNLDEAVREIRFSPLLQLGVRYAF